MTDVMPEQAVDLDEVLDNEPVAPVDERLDAVDEQLIARLVGKAREGGLALTGEGGLLAQLTKRLVESALEGELTDHLGYDRHDAAGRDGGNSRNGHRSKIVLTEVGPVQVDVPRDRDGRWMSPGRAAGAARAGHAAPCRQMDEQPVLVVPAEVNNAASWTLSAPREMAGCIACSHHERRRGAHDRA